MGIEALEKKVDLLDRRLKILETENRRLQKAKDILEIQNVMSMHEYYHAAGKNQEELDAIWAQEAPDVAFEEAAVHGRYVGLEAIREFGVVFFGRFFELIQDELGKIFPQLKDAPRGDIDGKGGMDVAGACHISAQWQTSSLLALGQVRGRFYKGERGMEDLASFCGQGFHDTL